MVFEFQTFAGALGIIDPILVSVGVDKKICVWDLHTLFANGEHTVGGSGAMNSAMNTLITNSASVHSLMNSSSSSGGSGGSGGGAHGGGGNAAPGEMLMMLSGGVIAYTAIPTFGAVESAFRLDRGERNQNSLGGYPRSVILLIPRMIPLHWDPAMCVDSCVCGCMCVAVWVCMCEYCVCAVQSTNGTNMFSVSCVCLMLYLAVLLPRLSKLVETYGGPAILALSTRLFFSVLLHDELHTDFITKFLHYYPTLVLSRIETDINFDRVHRQTSLLELAIVKQDQVCLHTIVNAWIYLLQPENSSNNNNSGDAAVGLHRSSSAAHAAAAASLTHTLFAAQKQHVSVRLSVRELLGLAESFPGEFCELVKHLRLIPAHEDCVRECHRVNLRIGASLEIAHRDSYCNRLWEEFMNTKYPQGGNTVCVRSCVCGVCVIIIVVSEYLLLFTRPNWTALSCVRLFCAHTRGSR